MPPGDRSNFEPAMSQATRSLLARVRQMVPPLRGSFHKGQLGRIGVLGGCEDYTGAPYFSAMASARLGCDMSHVICTPAAAAVIKTYSPNLMVHPLMRQGDEDEDMAQAEVERRAAAISARVTELLPRLHVLVVGPGLGRDPLMQATVARVVAAARERRLPLVLDADALLVVQRDPALVRGYDLAVLTPNVVEFGRLEAAFVGEKEKEEGSGSRPGNKTDSSDRTSRALRLANALGVTVVQKGAVDVVAGPSSSPSEDGDDALQGPFVCDLPGGRKRSGGQGDTLTGAIATFLGWRKAYLDGLWAPAEEEGGGGDGGGAAAARLGERASVLLAAFGGSAITRESSRLAFAKTGRSLQASDLTDEVHTAFLNLFGEKEADDEGEASKL